VRAQPVPAHVAVIMDGNGRWATGRGLPRVAGHREGVKAARALVRAADAVGLRFLTLYAFSTENWNRPEDEVTTLLRLLEESIYRELPELMERNVRLRVIGRPTGVPLLYDLDDTLHSRASRYLGDAEAIQARAEAVARQTETRR